MLRSYWPSARSGRDVRACLDESSPPRLRDALPEARVVRVGTSAPHASSTAATDRVGTQSPPALDSSGSGPEAAVPSLARAGRRESADWARATPETATMGAGTS